MRYFNPFSVLRLLVLLGLFWMGPGWGITPVHATSRTADFSTVVVFQDKVRKSVHGKIYLSPPYVRIEPELLDIQEDYGETFLYDWSRRKMRRVFADDQIFFEVGLSRKSRQKAMQEGWIPWKKSRNRSLRWIRLKEDFVNGRPCVLELLERTEKIKRRGGTTWIRDYSLYWKALDLDRVPVRIIYFMPDKSTVFIDYTNIELQPIPVRLFQPPEDFLSLSPF